MSHADIERLVARLSHLVTETGGSILLTTSARTPLTEARRLVEAVASLGFCYTWGAGETDNPYYGILSLSDSLLVTSESASMIAEAVNTGRPVELFHLQQRISSRFTTALWQRAELLYPLAALLSLAAFAPRRGI
jgi:mitochondrial fission protein ELM1